MSVIAISSKRIVPETELQQFEQLAVTLAGRLTHLPAESIGPAIAEALEQVAAAMGVGACQLIEFTEAGAVARSHFPTRAPSVSDGASATPVAEEWLIGRLARGEMVAISRLDELPREAIVAREQARRTGAYSILGLPASVAGRVVCALVIDGVRSPRRFPQNLVEHLQLISEILGAALQRWRHENALRASIAEIERLNTRLQSDNVYLMEEIKGYHDFDDIVGESAPLRVALARLGQVAPTNSSVLLLGPTGTGKELFARALHARSRRQARAFVRVNCAALPPTLVESELFGHEKGAFTGAVAMRQGRFELADGGTIFLDEIGDLSPDIQVKFLRVLQEGEFERVGSSRTKRVDVRVIAATHRDLEAAVAERRFRADLYYRLSVYPIQLPSLQERREDIARLVWFFINRHQRELGRRITKVPQAVMQALQDYSWPGNVRELENVVERAMIASNGDMLQLDDTLASSRLGRSRALASDNLDAVQRAHIEAVLQECHWRINGTGNAAERLGVHPNTLRFRMKKLGVVCPEGRARRHSQPDQRQASGAGT
jgi:transcriptional regulator with GAF, ATPase, and Fis domain